MLKAKINGKWFEVLAFYVKETPHPSMDKNTDHVFVAADHGVLSGMVDVSTVEEFKFDNDIEGENK